MNSFRNCLWLALLLYSTVVECAVTMEQMQKTVDIVRSVCLSRIKTTAEMADGIKVGNFPNDKNLKCYVQWVYEMTGMMKKNKQNEGAIKQMDKLLPDELLEDNKNAMIICKNAVGGNKDACEAAYALVQCVYKNSKKFTFA